jgi:hypothetical protein
LSVEESLHNPARRGSLALAAIAGLIASFILAIAPAFATHVTPQLHQGNPTCGTLNTDYDHEFKVQPVTAGLKDDPNSTFQVTLTLHTTSNGPTVDWASNLPVDAVFVKGGPGGNLYTYNGATSDTGLHAPGNDQGTAVPGPPWQGLSHISFCFNDVPATPTPTPATPTPTPATPTPTPEGSVAGGTGTPAASVPDTAMSSTGFSGPLATLLFGVLLIASLGALAYANVRTVHRRP